jgi:hypothetical protein
LVALGKQALEVLDLLLEVADTRLGFERGRFAR